ASNSPVYGFTATFKVRMGFGSPVPADGFSFVWGNNLPGTAFGEEGAGYGLVISFDTSDDGNGEAPAIDVRWRSAAAQGLVTVTVMAETAPPVATADYPVIDLPSDVIDLTATLLSNDTDPDDGETPTLHISSVATNGTLGTVTLSNGVVLYRPPV